MSTAPFSIDHDAPEVIAALDSETCRHCGNTRSGSGPQLCSECGRCYGLNRCQDSPECAIHDPAYDGDEDVARIALPAVLHSTPANGSIDVAIDAALSITLGKLLNPDTITIESVYLVDEGGNRVGPDFELNYSESAGHGIIGFSFLDEATLANSTNYRFRITRAVLDVNGLCLIDDFTSEDGITTVAA